MCAYLQGGFQGVDVEPAEFADIIKAVTEAVLPGGLLVLENIHAIGSVEGRVLKHFIEGETSEYKLMVTARPGEFTSKPLEQELQSLIRSKRVGELELGYELDTLIDTFVDRNCSADLRSPLMKSRKAASFQEFVFGLKEYKANQYVMQDSSGMFRPGPASANWKTRDYQAHYRSMLEFLGEKVEPSKVELLLSAAAVYGLEFPKEFLDLCLGDDSSPLLEELILCELILPTRKRNAKGLIFQFDHELTQSLIYKETPELRRIGLHESAIEYIKSPERYVAGSDDHRLAHHCSVVAYHHDAVHYFLGAGKYAETFGQYEEAKMRYLDARDSYRDFELADADHCEPALEFDILHHLVCSLEMLGETSELRRNTLRVMETLLRYPQWESSDPMLRGLISYHFCLYYGSTSQSEKAWERLEEAFGILRSLPLSEYLGKFYNYASLLKKK
ncbi:MAG: hypothetical protein AAF492_23145, partial [Verrucomicrobiota bacterium]